MRTIRLEADNSEYRSTQKAYIAHVTGPDRKFGWSREFLPKSALITDVGIYEICDIDRKGRKNQQLYAILDHPESPDEFLKIKIRDTTALELLNDDRPLSDLVPIRDEDGRWTIRDADGALTWRREPAAADARAQALETIRSLMREHGISLEEIGAGATN